MANFKPYPKKQKEISISQHTAFDKERGNPIKNQLKIKQVKLLIDQLK